jgi:cytochrome c553
MANWIWSKIATGSLSELIRYRCAAGKSRAAYDRIYTLQSLSQGRNMNSTRMAETGSRAFRAKPYRWARLAAGLLAALLGAGAFAADRDGAQIAATVCAACHGADGNSMLPVNPHLAQQSEQYIAAQLAAFKSGARANAVMQSMAAGLSPGEMKSVGAFYARQRLTKAAAARNKILALEGQQIWRAGIKKLDVPACAGCHGPAGAGIPAQYPRVAGQWADYTLDSLKQYASGTRKNAVMQPIAQRLSETQMKALSEYMAGLR